MNRVTDTKQVLVRYMGHEVRTPLNVIVSGLTILKTDISNLQSAEERASLLDTVSSMYQVSEDLLQTMNDLLLLEKIESDGFFIQEKLVSCSKLQQMAETYNILAREKGVNFSVRCLLDPQPADIEEVSADIESGDIKQPDPTAAAAAALSISVDELKIGQVIRNLVTNAIKFTPAEEAVTVTIRPATSADLAEAESLRSKRKSKKKNRSKTKAERVSVDESDCSPAGHVVVEVVDSGAGAGIGQDDWWKAFDNADQFDAKNLQVERA